jgi:hypothetical protein
MSVRQRPIASGANQRLAVRRAHDDEQKQHGHHDFGQQRRKKIVVARRMLRVAVGRKSLGEIETRSALGNGIEQERGHEAPTSWAMM